MVFNSIFVFYPEALHRKHNKKLGLNFFENVVSEFGEKMPNCALNVLFYVLYATLRDVTQKKLLKTDHQCTFVYIMNFTKKNPFLGIVAALRPSF